MAGAGRERRSKADLDGVGRPGLEGTCHGDREAIYKDQQTSNRMI